MRKLLLASAVLALSVQAAAAHMSESNVESYQTGYVNKPYTACVSFDLSFGDGPSGENPGGLVKGFVRSRSSNTHGADCDSDWVRPKGFLATTVRLWKWTGEKWALCAPRYSKMGIWHSSSSSSYFGWKYSFSQPPCGRGAYAATGAGLLKDHSGDWFATGFTETQTHYV